MKNVILKWQKTFGISQWDITTERIDPNQVTYIDSCPPEDRYFIGISKDIDSERGVIYHDRDLYEEAIIHELLHVRYPDENEAWIDNRTTELFQGIVAN